MAGNLSDSHSDTLHAESWAAVSPYVPQILVEAMNRLPERVPPWAEQVEGTLLLSDISGFTRLSEGLAEAGKEGAERLTNLMNEYFRMVLDIARSYGGTNLKFGGDALLLFFRGENHSARAVTTGLSMRRATQKFTFHLGRSRLHLDMTLGVHSGEFYFAVAGAPGERMQHFVLGGGVNRIAQVQASATKGQMLATESLFSLLGGAAIAEPTGDAYRILRLSKRIAPLEEEAAPSYAPSSVGEMLAYVPPPISQSSGRNGGVTSIEGEHRKVTIAFINLLGINELLAEKGVSALLGELQQYLSWVIRLSRQYGGFLVSNDIYTEGIKLIVIFGAPIAHEGDSANSLRFALQLKRELSRLDSGLAHRIGVNSGFVFAGDVGAPYRREYTVMGDAVNLAARLMSSAKPNQILVSRTTADEAGPGIAVEALKPIRVKGKKEPVPICSVEGEGSIPPSTAGQSSRLLGRETEIESFQRLCREVEQGEGRILVISGGAGIGKSRLLAEFRAYFQAWDWVVHHGAGYSYASHEPFAPWISVLNSLFRITPEEDVETRSQKVLETVQRLLPNLVEMTCLFNPLLSLNIPLSDVVSSIDDETRRRRFFELVTGLFQVVSRDGPVAIVVEDLHWADASSIELVHYLSRNVRGERLMVCLTHRPDVKVSLPEGLADTIDLSELPRETALQLVCGVLDQRQLPESVANIIVSKARGNPLFLEEIAISLRRSGVLERMKDLSSLQLTEQIALLNIPDRVQSLVMARIDVLDEGMKQMLRVASVLGDEFDVPALGALLNLPRHEPLETQLQELAELDLVHSVGEAPVPAYRFKHAVIREVAYDSLLFSRRRELHHRAAEHLEDRHQEQLEAFFDVLVHHYSQSRDAPKMRLYALKAGDKARRMFAHEQAIDYYRRGLTTLEAGDGDTAGQRSCFLERIGDSHEAWGNHSEAVRAYLQSGRQWAKATRLLDTIKADSLLMFGDSHPPGIRSSVLDHKTGVAYERNSDYAPALRRLASALQRLPRGHPGQSARIMVTRSLALFRKGKYEEATHWGRLGLRLSRRTGDRGNLAYAYNLLASSYLDTGNIRKAMRYRQSAISLYEELGDLSGQADAHNNLGLCYQSLGNQADALRQFEINLSLSERMGNFINVAIAHNNIGEVLLVMNRLDEAERHLQKVVETYERKGDPVGCCGLALVNLSRVYQRKKEYEKAFASLQEGVRLLRKVGARGVLLEASLQEAELQLETGHADTALGTCERALREAGGLGNRLMEARGLRITGRINLALGNCPEAESNFRDSIALAEHLNAAYDKALALFCAAQMHSTMAENEDNRRRCLRNLQNARALFARLGAQADLEQVVLLQNRLRSCPTQRVSQNPPPGYRG